MMNHIFLISFFLLLSIVQSILLGQKQTIDKSFEKDLQPSQMQLICNKKQPIWRFNDQPDTEQNPLFRINGQYLFNAQPTSSDYNGNYMCIDGSGESTGIEYVVHIQGTSNLSTGAIVGIVFAVIFAIIIIVVGLWFAHKNGYLGGESHDYDENDKLQGHDVEVDDYDRSSHAGRFRNAGQTSVLN